MASESGDILHLARKCRLSVSLLKTWQIVRSTEIGLTSRDLQLVAYRCGATANHIRFDGRHERWQAGYRLFPSRHSLETTLLLRSIVLVHNNIVR